MYPFGLNSSDPRTIGTMQVRTYMFVHNAGYPRARARRAEQEHFYGVRSMFNVWVRTISLFLSWTPDGADLARCTQK